MSNTEYVILVDKDDQELGFAEKMEAHEQGWLHRAFSIFIFNSKNELLLQKRASEKYHSPGLWTNSCCSHPRRGESIEEAAHRRLKEELGLRCALSKQFHFVYRAEMSNALIEHEFDHVFVGYTDELPILNPHEVEECCFRKIEELNAWLERNPDDFTEWFKICWPTVQKGLIK